MSDGPETPWVPPSATTRREGQDEHPLPAPSLPPLTPWAPTLPAGFTSNPVPPAPRRRWWLVPVVIAAAGIVLAGVIGLVVVVVLAVSQLGSIDEPDQPLQIGAPASPIAEEPLQCPPACFTEESIPQTLAYEGAFVELGLPDDAYPYGTYEPTTTGELFRRDASSWADNNAQPDACFFVPSSAPYASSILSADSRSPDPIYFTGTHLDAARVDGIDQAVRLFPDSESAEAYLADLADNINECTNVQFGPANDRYSATVNAASAIGTPASVASAGWIRTGVPGQRWRAYNFDLQRGNMVVRIRLLTDGTILESEFRRFVQFYAAQLGAIEPPSH